MTDLRFTALDLQELDDEIKRTHAGVAELEARRDRMRTRHTVREAQLLAAAFAELDTEELETMVFSQGGALLLKHIQSMRASLKALQGDAKMIQRENAKL